MAVITPEILDLELKKPGRSQSALARAMGVDPAIINRMVRGLRQIKAVELPLIDAYLRATGEAPFAPEPVDTVPVVGAVEAGAWREPGLWDGGEDVPIMASAANGDLFALRVVGSSMNLRYPEGTYVIARKWEGGDWPVGKNVIVQRTDGGGKVETTLKELVMGEDGLELWPRSSDPRFQEPVMYKADDATVEIIGRVISSYRVED